MTLIKEPGRSLRFMDEGTPYHVIFWKLDIEHIFCSLFFGIKHLSTILLSNFFLLDPFLETIPR